MKVVKSGLLAAMLAIAAASPAAALTNAEVLDAMDVRIAELFGQITELQDELATVTDPAAAAIRRNIQMLNVRRGQLISLKRVVPRYDERRLIDLVTHYDLDVSPA